MNYFITIKFLIRVMLLSNMLPSAVCNGHSVTDLWLPSACLVTRVESVPAFRKNSGVLQYLEIWRVLIPVWIGFRPKYMNQIQCKISQDLEYVTRQQQAVWLEFWKTDTNLLHSTLSGNSDLFCHHLVLLFFTFPLYLFEPCRNLIFQLQYQSRDVHLVLLLHHPGSHL